MTKNFSEIFSEKKANDKKTKIQVDYREKNSMLPYELIEKGFSVEFKELKVADYIVNGIAIERKTINDFISSMINGRLAKQLQELNQYKKKLLFIEGFKEQELYDSENNTNFSNSIRGFLLSITIKHNVPIIYSADYKDSAKYIELISRKKEIEHPLNVKKRTLNKKEQLQYIIEGFPGIGPKTARKLLQKFKSIKAITNASEEELRKILGKKANYFYSLIKEKY